MLVGGVGRSGLGAVEEVRVVGALAQLHEDVLQAHLLQLAGAVDDVDVAHQNLGVHLALHLAQAHVHLRSRTPRFVSPSDIVGQTKARLGLP